METVRPAAMREAETVVTHIHNSRTQKVVVEVHKLKDMIVMSMPAGLKALSWNKDKERKGIPLIREITMVNRKSSVLMRVSPLQESHQSLLWHLLPFTKCLLGGLCGYSGSRAVFMIPGTQCIQHILLIWPIIASPYLYSFHRAVPSRDLGH